MMELITWPYVLVVDMDYLWNGSRSTLKMFISLRYILSLYLLIKKFTEERTEWLEEWLEDNEIKTLEECRVWKEDMPLLNGPVIGIPVMPGHGCPECLFSQERARNITSHVVNMHGRRGNVTPIPCSIQRIFVSNLHGWWRVNTEPEIDETTDEGLLALRHFSTEFDRLAYQTGDSEVGIYFIGFISNLINSCSSYGSKAQIQLDVEIRLGCSFGRNGMAGC
jgi:hypothetical protein